MIQRYMIAMMTFLPFSDGFGSKPAGAGRDQYDATKHMMVQEILRAHGVPKEVAGEISKKGTQKESTIDSLTKKCAAARTTEDIIRLYENVGIANLSNPWISARLGVKRDEATPQKQIPVYIKDPESLKKKFSNSTEWKLWDEAYEWQGELTCTYYNPKQKELGSPYFLHPEHDTRSSYLGDLLLIHFKEDPPSK